MGKRRKGEREREEEIERREEGERVKKRKEGGKKGREQRSA